MRICVLVIKLILIILSNFILLWTFTVYMENSLRFEISLRSNLHRSEYHFAWRHVNAENEAALHRSEILPQKKFQTGLSLVCVSCKHVWLREKGIKFSPSKKLLRLFKTMERDYLINLIKNTFSFTIHIID